MSVVKDAVLHELIKDLIEILTEANQELPSWLESIGMDSRFSFGGKRSRFESCLVRLSNVTPFL